MWYHGFVFRCRAEREVRHPNRETQKQLAPCAIGLPFAGMSDPVVHGVFHAVRHMEANGKTAGKTATNNGGAKGAANTTKGNGKWRTVTRKGERVLIDPEGHIYRGTAREVRDAAMTPLRRGTLARDIRLTRKMAKYYTPAELRDYIAEKRREAIERNDYDAIAKFITHFNQELGIVANAAARYMGQTVEAFIADAVDAAIRGTIDLAELDAGKPGAGLPLTRHERAALDRIKRDKARILAANERRMAALDAEKAARLAKLKARAKAKATA